VALAPVPVLAATLEVAVVDEQGQPLERVAVYAVPTFPLPTATPRTGEMDQERTAFVPHILIVQKGANVDFPNNDTVSHHVYSFSPAKTFELGLYKGNAHEPVQFEQTGVVTLGCNIHDGMLGYILVVDTPFYALTNEHGKVALDSLPMGQYTLNVWTPRARPNQQPAPQALDLAAQPHASVSIRISGKLMPDHDQPSALKWQRY
jgi:plastocyanin